jgi:TupA-like ATPgrasp
MPDSLLQIREWRKAHGVYPRVIRPLTFNEKILHRNLFDRRTVLTEVADKASVRSYIEQRLDPQILPKLYYITSRPETIPFDELPNRFVVKPTHGSGWVHLVTDKSTLDRAALLETCSGWLKRSFYQETREIVYKHIKPRIIVEEFIDDGSGTAPKDYKLFVFGGIVELIQVDTGRLTAHRRGLYTPAWEKINVRYEYDEIIGEVPRPAHLAEMVSAAETLGHEWDFVRVDFYDTGDHLYFGELTLTPEGGMGRFYPTEFDYYLGRRWNLRNTSLQSR